MATAQSTSPNPPRPVYDNITLNKTILRKKKNSMFKRMIRKLWIIGRDTHEDNNVNEGSVLVKENFPQPIDGITLTFTSCDGGIFINLSKYDEKTHNWLNKKYIAHDNDDLGDKINKILSFNSLQT